MKFYGNGLVWDTEKEEVLCRFENGEYNTKVKREQDILKKLGYKQKEK